MNERSKLQEAKYFYAQMVARQNQRDEFEYNLSAFLSAARSVLQYAAAEAQLKPNGQKWYEDQISSSRLLKYFKDKRDINIHVTPVKPRVTYYDTGTAISSLKASGSDALLDKDGNITQQSEPRREEESPKPTYDEPKNRSSTVVEYAFDDRPGDEDVLALCQSYIQELEKVISDGNSKLLIPR